MIFVSKEGQYLGPGPVITPVYSGALDRFALIISCVLGVV